MLHLHQAHNIRFHSGRAQDWYRHMVSVREAVLRLFGTREPGMVQKPTVSRTPIRAIKNNCLSLVCANKKITQSLNVAVAGKPLSLGTRREASNLQSKRSGYLSPELVFFWLHNENADRGGSSQRPVSQQLRANTPLTTGPFWRHMDGQTSL